MVEFRNLAVNYKDAVGLESFSETVLPGTITGVVGPNGAGKSTLLRAIAGLTGDFDQHGEVIFANSTTQRNGRPRYTTRVAYCPTETISFLDLTPRENLYLISNAMKLEATDVENRVAQVIDLLGLTPFADRPVSSLSAGIRRRTDIGLTIIRRAELYVFDEPYVGLDAEGAQCLSEVARLIKAESRMVVIASHASDLLLPICEVVWELDNGALVNSIRAPLGTITKDMLLLKERAQPKNVTLPWIADLQ